MKALGLEAVFKEATQRHESLALLFSQWSFDKELISKALQNVSSIFPHYSRHDASHSKQIVVNIERMLGDKVNHLTATDLWLILESAYSHDIGMVVTEKQVADLDSEGFNSFVGDVAADSSNPLQSFASSWIKGNATLPSGTAAHLMVEEYKQLLAEWFRVKHSENSAKIIQEPVVEIGLNSPRNELLPKRLFNVLASICLSHGQSFDDVMKLPFSEAGMATEDCHPRYVACLLRMADLLDIDDNRFCPVMMRMSGAKFPEVSQSHFDKHQSIKNFRLDSERIKVEAACPNPAAYEVTHDWFSWLEQEYHSQSQHWPKIVPNKKLGRLPTLAPPKVTLKPPYVTLSTGRKPSFKVDEEAVFKLLRTTGLYAEKTDGIREILQNAVDSSLITIWKKYKNRIIELDPSSKDLKVIYDKYRIGFDLEVNEHDERKAKLIVQDNGEGMALDDLRRMLMVGASSKSLQKNRLIREMPVWFRPSGQFGIGLQSIYLLTNKFTVFTRSRNSHESFKLEFTQNKSNSLTIERLMQDEKYGARFEIEIELDDFPNRMSFGWDDNRELYLKKLNNYDFTRKNSSLVEYDKLQVISAAVEFEKGSPIKISAGAASDSSATDSYWCGETNVLLSNIRFGENTRGNLDYRFRGQPISKFRVRTPFVAGFFDFYGFGADGFLTYNREGILPEAYDTACECVDLTITSYIRKFYSTMHSSQQPYAAAVMYILGDEPELNPEYKPGLENLPLHFVNKPSCSLIDFIEKILAGEVRRIIPTSTNTFNEQIEQSEHEWYFLGGEDIYRLILVEATRNGMYWQELTSPAHIGRTTSEWHDQDVFPICDEIFKGIFDGSRRHDFGRRMLFPCWGPYRRLAINAEIMAATTVRHHSYYNDYLVLPFSFDWERNASIDMDSDLIDWVYEHRKIREITRNEIVDLYELLLNDLKHRIPNAEGSGLNKRFLD